MKKLTVTEIVCNKTTSSNQDDFFVLIQADAGPPVRYPVIGVQKLKKGGVVALPSSGLVVPFDYGVVITAWEHDNVSDNDYLFNISANNQSSSGTKETINHNGSDYSYVYTISG